MLKIKSILVMIVKRFEIGLVYENLSSAKGIRIVYNQRHYQIQRAQPSDYFPCGVSKVVG